MTVDEIKNNQYFKTLPKMTQESILMSGLQFESENQIRQFAGNLEQKR